VSLEYEALRNSLRANGPMHGYIHRKDFGTRTSKYGLMSFACFLRWSEVRWCLWKKIKLARGFMAKKKKKNDDNKKLKKKSSDPQPARGTQLAASCRYQHQNDGLEGPGYGCEGCVRTIRSLHQNAQLACPGVWLLGTF